MNIDTAKNELKNPPKVNLGSMVLEIAVLLPATVVLYYLFA